MASGWLDLEKLSHKPFSHYYRGLITPKAAVLHIMEGGLWGSWDWLERHVQLSTTFGVGKNGDAWQGVSIFNGAYGNGITYIDGTWRSRSGRQMQPTWHGLVPPVNPNRYTLSIEHEGFTGQPLTDAMKQTTVAILVACAKLAGWSAYQPGVNLIRHADINPVDKDRCPGTTFDLHWFAAEANKHLHPTAPKPERLPPWSRRWYTTLNDANIREGPGTAYPIVGTASTGQRLDVFDIEDEGEPVNGNGQWLRCRAGDDVPGGFVSATLADLVVRSFVLPEQRNIRDLWRSDSDDLGDVAAGEEIKIAEVVLGEDPFGDGRNLWGRKPHSDDWIWLGGATETTVYP